jgi:hypothetical protein
LLRGESWGNRIKPSWYDIGRYIGTEAAAANDLIEVQLGIQHLYIA